MDLDLARAFTINTGTYQINHKNTGDIPHFEVKEQSQGGGKTVSNVIRIEPWTDSIDDIEKIFKGGRQSNGNHLIAVPIPELYSVLHSLKLYKNDKSNQVYAELEGPIADIIPKNGVNGVLIDDSGVKQQQFQGNFNPGGKCYGIFVKDSARAILIDETVSWWHIRTGTDEYRKASSVDLNRQNVKENVTLLEPGAFVVIKGQLQTREFAESLPTVFEKRIQGSVENPIITLQSGTFEIRVEAMSVKSHKSESEVQTESLYQTRTVTLEYVGNDPATSAQNWRDAISSISSDSRFANPQ